MADSGSHALSPATAVVSLRYSSRTGAPGSAPRMERSHRPQGGWSDSDQARNLWGGSSRQRPHWLRQVFLSEDVRPGGSKTGPWPRQTGQSSEGRAW